MENIPDTAAQSIREIERLVRDAASTTIQKLSVPDGAGNTLDVPLAVGRNTDGTIEVMDLDDSIRAAAKLVKDLRLAESPGPDARTGVARHQSLESFNAHANRFKSKASAIWADEARRELVSILDYHPEGAESKAAWGRHRGSYPCPLSEAWTAWGGGKPLELDQDAFAELLDARDRELSEGTIGGTPAPSPASLITLANSLEVFSAATAKRERDPNTGRVKVSFTEEKGVSGTVIPPPAFLVSIPVFQDSPAQRMEVRLRVTVEGGHASFRVQIHAAVDVLRQAFLGLTDQVETLTDLPIFLGTPEA